MANLEARSDRDFTGQYIAEILGTDPQYGYSRSFVGAKNTDGTRTYHGTQRGFYEVCDVSKKGKIKTYVIVRDGNTIWIDERDADRIVRLMTKGHDPVECIRVVPADKSAVKTWTELKFWRSALYILSDVHNRSYAHHLTGYPADTPILGSVARPLISERIEELAAELKSLHDNGQHQSEQQIISAPVAVSPVATAIGEIRKILAKLSESERAEALSALSE